MRVVGQTLTGKLDGLTLGSITDTTLSEGRFGIGMSVKPTAPLTVTSFEVLDLDGTDVAASPASKSPVASPQAAPAAAGYAQPAKWLDATPQFLKTRAADLKTEGEWIEPVKSTFYKMPEVADVAVRCVFANRIEIRLRKTGENSETEMSYIAGISGHVQKAYLAGLKSRERTTLAESPISIATDGSEHELVVTIQGEQMELWLDGSRVLEARDAAYPKGAPQLVMIADQAVRSRLKKLEYGELKPGAVKPAAIASNGPASPVSPSGTKFPPGQCVKPYTKFEDLPPKARSEIKLTWKDGWIDGTNSTDKFALFTVVGSRGKNQGIRARLKHVPGAERAYPATVSVRAVQGKRYSLNYSLEDQKARIALAAQQTTEAIATLSPKSRPQAGAEYDVEFFAVGEKLIGRINGELLPVSSDKRIGEGDITLQIKHLIRDIEVINLDGLSEAEALKLAGVDEQGKDLRAPAAPVATGSPSPSPPVSQSGTQFPPGQWVKIYTKAEDLPAELRKPDSGVKFEDGWFRFSGPTKVRLPLPAELTTNYAVRVHALRSTGKTEGAAGIVLRRQSGSKYYQFKLSGGTIAAQCREDGATYRTLGFAGQVPDAPGVGQEYILEAAAVGSRLIARIGSTHVRMAADTTYQQGVGHLEFVDDLRDIEVVNLDGLSEAEALKILGVDEKGNDLRAAAAVAEKQAMEQAKAVDAMVAIPELKVLHDQFVKLTAERVTAPFDAEVAKLNAGYLGGIDREIASEKKAGHLDGIIALEAEKKLITEQHTVPAEDAADATASLKKLRGIYRTAHAKLEATRAANLKALTDPLTARLKLLEADLTKKDRVDHAKQVKAYRENLGKAPSTDGSAGVPSGAAQPARNATPTGAAATTDEADKNVLAPLPSGVLHGAGKFLDIPIDLSKFGDLNGFVQVTCGPNSWAALRADGSVISSHPKINGLKDIVSVNYTSQGLAVIPKSRKGITVAWAGGALTAVEIEAASYGGGRVMDVALSGQNNLILLKEDRTIRLIGPSFPVSKTLQETKAITDVVSITSGGGWLAALDARGKVHAWTWWTPNSDVHEGPARSVEVPGVPADAALLFASGTQELRSASRSGTWKIYTFGPDCRFEAKVDRPLPENWQRPKGNIVLNSDGTWAPLQPLNEDISAVMPQDRKMLDLSMVNSTSAKNNAKSAMALWIEPADAAP